MSLAKQISHFDVYFATFNILHTPHDRAGLKVHFPRKWPVVFKSLPQARSRFLWGRSWSRSFWRPCCAAPGVPPSPRPSCPGWRGWRPASPAAASRSWLPIALWERASQSHSVLSARALTTSSVCPHTSSLYAPLRWPATSSACLCWVSAASLSANM